MVDTHRDGATEVVLVRGEVDMATAPLLRAVLETVLAGGRPGSRSTCPARRSSTRTRSTPVRGTAGWRPGTSCWPTAPGARPASAAPAAAGRRPVPPGRRRRRPAIRRTRAGRAGRAGPSADRAGCSLTELTETGGRTPAYANGLSMTLDQAQYDAGAGPCLSAASTGAVERVDAVAAVRLPPPGLWGRRGGGGPLAGVRGRPGGDAMTAHGPGLSLLGPLGPGGRGRGYWAPTRAESDQ